MNTTSALNPEAHHLDLGCGAIPRNPYYAGNLYGVDVRSRLDEGKIKFSKANLIFEKIPYVDNTFDSVSAYDFLEHIPRVIYKWRYRTYIYKFNERDL